MGQQVRIKTKDNQVFEGDSDALLKEHDGAKIVSNADGTPYKASGAASKDEKK